MHCNTINWTRKPRIRDNLNNQMFLSLSYLLPTIPIHQIIPYEENLISKKLLLKPEPKNFQY